MWIVGNRAEQKHLQQQLKQYRATQNPALLPHLRENDLEVGREIRNIAKEVGLSAKLNLRPFTRKSYHRPFQDSIP